ncbi:LapA family protein [Hoyosella altamirensis]|uniref:Putative integral membrane protein n=1 Tax=Hoyosella altamirensis TaxID=616997 RepID=A0A839RP88_9ACTN|nr:lipopolysaccharide assembly protein LapA domain-containing protein [Hoyosella altamirensis]MBB3038605.1 putative integral membrane protein [Hoyosella altamirensis]
MASKSGEPSKDHGTPQPDLDDTQSGYEGWSEPEEMADLPQSGSELPVSATSTPPHGKAHSTALPHTRAGAWWSALIIGALLLILLLVFILQNLASTTIFVLFWEWDMPLGVALLGAAILGILIAACIGGVRILQLRRTARKGLR